MRDGEPFAVVITNPSKIRGLTASKTHMLVGTHNDRDGHVVVDIRDGQKNDEYGVVVFNRHLRIDSKPSPLAP
jgi:hypothetical protein